MQENRRVQPLLPASDYLLIDEAQQLPQQAEGFSQHVFDSAHFKRQFLQLNEEGLFEEIAQIITEDDFLQRMFSLYRNALSILVETQEQYFRTLSIDAPELQVVHHDDLYDGTLAQDKLHQKLSLYYQEINEIQQQLRQRFELTNDRWYARQRIVIARLFDFFSQMDAQEQTVTAWLTWWHPRYVHWLKKHPQSGNAVIELADLEGHSIVESTWYQRYQHIIYLGGH